MSFIESLGPPYPSLSLGGFDCLRGYFSEALKVKGDVAEVGVYEGGTALFLCDWMRGSGKELYLFDNFLGFQPTAEDYPLGIPEGWYEGGEEKVRDLFKDEEKVHIVTGNCVETIKGFEDKTFCFVHLDLDLYAPTKACLKFFLDRMIEGGVIMVHDYRELVGVTKAVREIVGDLLPEEGYAVIRM